MPSRLRTEMHELLEGKKQRVTIAMVDKAIGEINALIGALKKTPDTDGAESLIDGLLKQSVVNPNLSRSAKLSYHNLYNAWERAGNDHTRTRLRLTVEKLKKIRDDLLDTPEDERPFV